MSQAAVILPGPPLTGAAAAGDMNAAWAAMISKFSGVTAPTLGPGGGSALVVGQDWVDSSAAPIYTWNLWDGNNWVPFLTLNATSHVITVSGAGAAAQRSVTTTPIVISSTDRIINCNIGSAASCSLPTAASRNGVPLTFKDLGQATAHNITITPNGAETIDGVNASVVITSNFGWLTLVPFNDGVNSGWVKDDVPFIPTITSFNTRTGAVVPALHDYTTAQVDYTSAKANSVLRTTRSKLDNIPNVFDYGVVGDGTTDDTTNFQRAINSNAGGSLYVPAATYKITAALTISVANTKLFGDGWGSIISQATLSANVITVSAGNCEISDLALTYPSAASSGAVALRMGTGTTLFSNRANNLNISNCYHGLESNNENGAWYDIIVIGTHGGNAFYLNATTNVFATKVFTVNGVSPPSTSVGLAMSGNTQGCNLSDCSFFQAFRTMIVSGSSQTLGSCPAFNKFQRCYFDSGSQDAQINQAFVLIFNGCWFSNGRTGGGFSGLTINNGDALRFYGTEFINCGGDGCIVFGGSDTTFGSGCAFIGNSVTAGASIKHGLEIAAGVKDFSVTSCISKNDSTLGFGTQGWGILVNTGSSDRYIVANNLVTPNGTGGVSDGGSGVNKTVASNF